MAGRALHFAPVIERNVRVGLDHRQRAKPHVLLAAAGASDQRRDVVFLDMAAGQHQHGDNRKCHVALDPPTYFQPGPFTQILVGNDQIRRAFITGFYSLLSGHDVLDGVAHLFQMPLQNCRLSWAVFDQENVRHQFGLSTFDTPAMALSLM